MRVEKGAVFFVKIINLMFLSCFSVIRWKFGIVLPGSVIVDRMDIN